MKKHRFYNILCNAILATLVFVLSTDPILAAAKTLQKDPQSQAVDLVLQGGDLYLDSIASATVESAKLVNSIRVVQNTKIDQLNETYIEDVIDHALEVAEQSSIALGAVDDMADGVEQIGNDLPASMDIGQTVAAGLPAEMHADLAAQGIPSAQIDQISTSASDLFTSRQSTASGLPADLQTDLLSYGFTQSEIDQIAEAASQHGLVNGNLNTHLAQFRATQDELAGARTSMVILAVQLLGYQIAVRQSNGIQPRAATDAELEELAQDELRLLVHAAHLKALWGNDPNSEIGEGDWWFIEHYAGRAAERLQKIIVETQNRGLVTDLFLAYQMQMLAISARSGDADYAKAELDALVILLAHHLDAVAYYQQHTSPGLPELALARLAAIPSIREQITWPISEAAIKNAKLVSRGILDLAKVQDLQIIIGNFDESNETNNQGSTLIIAGFLFGSLQPQLVQPSMQLISDYTAGKYDDWFMAILTGNTDNPALFAANIILSIIPVIGVIPDIVTLIVDPDIFIKVVSIVGILCSLGDLSALLGPEAFPVALGTFVGDAFSALLKGFFRHADDVVKFALNALGIRGGFEIVIDLMTTALRRIGDTLGSTRDKVFMAISGALNGMWQDFLGLVRRAGGADLLRRLGVDEGTLLVGRIFNLGVELSDQAAIDGVRKLANEGSSQLAEGIARRYTREVADMTFRLIRNVPHNWGDEAYEGIARLVSVKGATEENYRIINSIMDTAARANFGEALFKRIKLATDAEIPGLDHMLREINGTWPSVKGAAHELDFAESLGFNNIRNSGQMEFQLGPNPQRAIDIVYEGRYYELKNITSWDSTEQLAYYLDNLSDAQAKNLYYVFRGSENNTILNAFKSALKASTDNQEIIDAIIKNVKWYGELY